MEVNLPRIETKRVIMKMEDDEEGSAEAMSPSGRAFNEECLTVHIISIIGFKNPLDLPSFKEHIQQTILKHKRFHSIPKRDKKGKLYWVPTQVNIDDHIIVPDENPLSNMGGNNYVEDYAVSLAQAPPLDPSRPLWEIHVLGCKLGDSSSNVIFRVHHSVGDGISLMSLFIASTRRVDDPDMLPTISSCPSKPPLNKSLLKNMLLLFWTAIIVSWYTFLDVCGFLSTTLWMRDSQTPMMGFPGVEHLSKRICYNTISFEDLTLVKKATNSTINDVMMGLLSAGVTRYLLNHNGSKKGQVDQSGNRTDEAWDSIANLRIRASALVNVRQSPGLQELDDMMRKGATARWGNQIGYVLLPIYTGHCTDTLEYVRRMKAICDRKKQSLEGPFTNWSMSMLMNLLGSKAATKLTYDTISHITLSISNVIGPNEQVQVCGNPITHIVPTVYGQPQALCFHIQSYMRKITLVLCGVKDVIPDLDMLLSHMMGAFEEMKQEAKSSRTIR